MKLTTFCLLLLLFSSCTDQTDGEHAAKEYCTCMIENKYEKQYDYAYTICKAEMSKKYRFYRITYVDMQDREFNKSLREVTRDSAKKFIEKFMDYKNSHDCAP